MMQMEREPPGEIIQPVHSQSPEPLTHHSGLNEGPKLSQSFSMLLEDQPANSSLNYSSLMNQKDQMQRLNKRLEEYMDSTKAIDSDIERLIKENKELRQRLQPDVNYQFDDLHDRYKDQFEALRSDIHNLSEECNRLEHDKHNCKTETELIEQKTKSLNEEKKILQRSIDQAEEESRRANEEHEVLTREIEQLQLEISRENEKYNYEKAQLEKRLNNTGEEDFEDPTLPEASGHIIHQIQDARREIGAATNRFHEQELEKLTEQIKIYRKDIIEKEQKHRALDREIDDLENQKHMLEAEVAEVNAKCEALEKSIDDMKTHHGTKIQSLEAKKAREMEQLENARQELAKIQEQLDAHLHDKQSLHEELDQMRKLLGLDDEDDLVSIISDKLSPEGSIRSSIRSRTSTVASTLPRLSREPSMRSSIHSKKSVKIEPKKEVVVIPVTPPRTKTPPVVDPVQKKQVEIKRLPSKRISFTKHRQGGPTIMESNNFDQKKELDKLKTAMKKKNKKGDLAVAEILLSLTTKQRHILEKEYDSTKKELRPQFQDKQRKHSTKGFNKTMQLVLANDSERDAIALNMSMLKRKETDFVEVLATRPSRHIRHIREVYQKIYGDRSLDKVMEKAFKDQHQLIKFLGNLLLLERKTENEVNTEHIEKDKLRMMQARNEQTWNDFEMVADTCTMLSTRSFGYLWYLLKKGFTADEYDDWKTGILHQVNSVDSNDPIHSYTRAVFTFLEFLHDLPATAFANSLHKAIHDTSDKNRENKVLYILLSRQEYDLKDIKYCYRNRGDTATNLEADLKTLKTDSFDSPELLELMVKDYLQT